MTKTANPIDMADEIEEALYEISEKRRDDPAGNATWTKDIKTRLCQLEEAKYLCVCTTGVEIETETKNEIEAKAATEAETDVNSKRKPNYGEWLYDLCWLDWELKRTPRLKSVVLAMESEWGNDRDIDDDFEKLVQSRARLRVMIFEKNNRQKVKETIGRLKSYAAGFEQSEPTDNYLFCGYDNARSEFICKFWQVSLGAA